MNAEVLNNSGVYDFFGGDSVDKLRFAKGDSIPLSDSKKRIYLVEEGLVGIEQDQEEFHKPLNDDSTWITKVVKPTMIFGFENFDGETTFNARVLTDRVVVQAVDIDPNNPDQMLSIYRLITLANEQMIRRRTFARNGYIPQRVAQALIDSALESEREGVAGEVWLMQEILGKIAGAARERVTLESVKLQKQRIIEIPKNGLDKGVVLIKDMERLQRKAARVYQRPLGR